MERENGQKGKKIVAACGELLTFCLGSGPQCGDGLDPQKAFVNVWRHFLIATIWGVGNDIGI